GVVSNPLIFDGGISLAKSRPRLPPALPARHDRPRQFRRYGRHRACAVFFRNENRSADTSAEDYLNFGNREVAKCEWCLVNRSSSSLRTTLSRRHPEQSVTPLEQKKSLTQLRKRVTRCGIIRRLRG